MGGPVLAALLLFGTACAAGEPRVPPGEPLSVVRAAPAITRNAGAFEVFVSRFGSGDNAEVDLGRGLGPTAVRREAERALDLLADAEEATPYGGQQVRGAPTFRYEVTNSEGATFNAWIDIEGRARRVLTPDGPLSASPAPTHPNGQPALLTIDFVFPG